MNELKGIVPVLPTPFNNQSEIDFDSLKKIVKFAVARNAGGVCTPGYASEFYKLSDRERQQVIETVVVESDGKVPVVACVGHPSTRVAIEAAQSAQRMAADVVCVLVPRMVPLDSEAIFHHLRSIAQSVGLPLMLQDADFAGSGLAVSLLARMKKEIPNLLYAKIECVLPGQRYSELLEITDGQLKILCGWAGMYMLDALERGACGVMPGCGLLEIYNLVYRSLSRGNPARARSIFFKLLPTIVFSMQDIELINLFDKSVLQARGVIASANLREPTRRFDTQYLKEVQEYCKYGIELLEGLEPD